MTAAVWQCGVCEGVNTGGTSCATCGAVIPPGAAPPPPPAPPVRPARSARPGGAGSAGTAAGTRSSPTAPRRPSAARPVRLPAPSSLRGEAPSSPPRSAPPPPADLLFEDLLAEILRPYGGAAYPPLAPPRRPVLPRRTRRPPATVIGLLSLLMVALGWAYTVSYAPGAAPRAMPEGADQVVPVPATCPTPPCAPPTVSSVGVATDGDDTLVLLSRPAPAPPGESGGPSRPATFPSAAGASPTPRAPAARSTTTTSSSLSSAGRSTVAPSPTAGRTIGPSPSPSPSRAAGPRLVLSFEGSTRRLSLDGDSDGRSWRVDDGTRTWIALARQAGTLDVVRLPGHPPSGRWSTTVDGVRVPAQGSSPVVELARPRDAIAQRPAPWLAGALLVSLLVALHGYHTASRRALRASLRSLAFGLLAVVGAPLLAAQFQDTAPGLPQLQRVALTLAPLLALAVAAATGRVLAARAPAADVPTPGLRLATALAALTLLALAAYTAELAVARLLPGLGG